MKGFWGKLTQAYIIIGLCAGSCLAATVTVTSDSFPLSIKHDGIRASNGEETLTYSSRWDGGDDATVTIAQDGVTIAEGLTGEDVCAWSVPRNGTYVLTHTTYTNGVAGKVESATFVVTGKDVPFTAADVTVSGYEGKYDGVAHGIAVQSAVEGLAVRYGCTPNGEFTADSPTLVDVGVLTVWCEIAAPGYITQTNSATVTIKPRSVTLTSGSASKVYDGAPLTVGTVTVGGDGFVDGEGATFDVTGAQTAVGTSANTFAYSLNDGTKAGNYAITTVYGTLEVTKALAGDLFYVIDLSGGPTAEHWPVSYLSAIPEGGWTDEYKTTKLVMRRIERGSISGINSGIYGGAVSSITIDKPYYIGVFEVTRAQYALMKGGTGDARPQIRLSYNALRGTSAGALYPDSMAVDSTSIIGILRAKTGLATLDLPTEAQWEYACRAGTTSDYNNGGSTEADLATLGRYKGNQDDGRGGYSGGVTTVGSYAPNRWGLYDMHGNAYEWCLEWYSQGQYRAVRGGSDYVVAGRCRSGKRDGSDPSNDLGDLGFRLCCSSEIAIEDGTGGAGGKDSRFSYSGMYDGQGHVIAVEVTSVSEPLIRYALAQEGPYSDSLLLTNACTETAVWYTVSADGYNTYTNWATVTIKPRSVTLTSGSASKVYDGAPLTVGTVAVGGDGFVDGEGATFDVTGAQTTVGTSENAFAYSLNDGTKAGNYEISTVYGTLEVTKATVGPGDGDEPGVGELPEGGASKFDVAARYDGEGHTIDTNALVAAFGAAMAGAGKTRFFYGSAAAGAAATGQGQDVGLSADAGAAEVAATGQGMDAGTGAEAVADWQEVAPAFTNAGEHAVWYKVVNPNYEDFVHRAKVTITPRAVTVKSRSRTKPYDGTPLRLTSEDIDVSLTDGGTESALPAGEAFAYGDFAERTAAGEVAATFTVSAGVGTQLANYALTVVYGTLTVAKATYPGQEPGGAGIAWSVAADAATWVYDGRPHGVALTGVPAGVTAHLSGNTATDAGDYVATATLDYDAANYEPPVAPAPLRWSIVPRPVTLVSAGAEKVYDGTPLRADAVRVKEGSLGFVGDEGFTAACRGALTDVGAMENLFDYALAGGALAGNYAIAKEYGWLRVTPAALDPGAVFGGGETDAEGRLVCTRVYNGAPQPFALAPDFGEPYRVFYALVAGDESAYSGTAPTRTHVAEGDLAVFFKFMSPNYAPYYGTGVLRIAPKALTDEMVVADEDAAWFFDGTEKKPSVTVVDGSPNVATADDWTVAYSDRTGAGLFPVTVTGRNDYCGTVTKEFAILKRPVAPPAIPSTAYSGRLQRPGVPADSRWTVVANPGGTDAGDYTNVVLRLTAPADYRWKGLGEDETDWTGVFTIRRGANGWSVYPLIRSWTNGVDAAGEPLGRPRFGTLSVAYRRRGASVAEESPLRPSAPGRYTARFWAEETANYAGVALAAPYEVDFEIFPGPGDPPAGDATATTPVPVPHAWLDAYVARFGAGDYEAAANAVGANGVALWESYVAGLDPADAASRFTAAITVGADGAPRVTWTPDLSGAEPPRVYTVYGKAGLGDAAWTPVTDANRARMRFFRVQVELK